VTEPMSARHDADDARLLNMVRGGDSEAFGVLQRRHEAAARRLARHLMASPYEVDDVVAAAFAWVFDVTSRGGGPSNAFRPYVLTALRRVCFYRMPGEPAWQRADDRALPEPGEPFVEPSMAGLETALIVRAYLSLPERWRAVLWHAQVEQASPADVAPLLGLTRNGVAALDRRASEGLRQAYLQHHLSVTRAPECRLVGERLGVFVRDPDAVADTAMVSAHLGGCAACQTVYAELADVGGTLRAVVGPLVLGPAAAAYLFGPTDSAAAAAASSSRSSGAHVSQAAAGGGRAALAGRATLADLMAGGQTVATTVLRAVRPPWRPRPAHGVAALGILAVVAVVALLVFVSGGGGSAPTSANRAEHPAAVAAPAISASALPQSSPSASASPSPSPVSSPPAPPPPSPGLSASVNVSSAMFGQAAAVRFQVTDTGSVATGMVTASITLPAGSSMFSRSGGDGSGGDGHGGHGDSSSATNFGGGWDCQPTTGGATCTHASIAPGQQTDGFLFVTVSDSGACGQPVQLTVSSGPAFAQASQDLSC
jgi:DNA-directed RNA polymerase specialized sigma24 family protein